MSLSGVCFSVVLKELWLALSFVSARTVSSGETIRPILRLANAAPAKAPAPNRKLRRLRYKCFGVISAEEISAGFLINIYSSCSTQMRALSIYSFRFDSADFVTKLTSEDFLYYAPRVTCFC